MVFDSCGSSYDTWLRVYDAAGTQIESCDDCGPCGTQTVLTTAALPAGSYTIDVEGYGTASGQYTVAMRCAEAIEGQPEHNTGCAADDLVAKRERALANMVDYARLQSGPDAAWGCTGELEYRVEHRTNITVGGEWLEIMQPCNTLSGLAMDDPLVCGAKAADPAHRMEPHLEKVAAAWAWGTAFFHASAACVNFAKNAGECYGQRPTAGATRRPPATPRRRSFGDVILMKLYVAKLLQMVDPTPRFNRVAGFSADKLADAATYESSIRNVDSLIDQFWTIITDEPVETWDAKMEALDAVIPDMVVSLTALGTRVAQTCDEFSNLGFRAALEIAAGPAGMANGYNPDTFRLPVNSAVCVGFVGALLPAIEPFSYQESIFPESAVNALRALLPGLMHMTGGGDA